MVLALCTSGCIITNPTEFVAERPLTPPRIRDEQGTTRPRLGNILELQETDPNVTFYVPVDDTGTNDPLQWQFFVNADRDCRTSEGGDCSAPQQSGELSADGNVRRYVEYTLRENRFVVGCNRVELWVSSRFLLSGNRHTPARVGDVDFTTWWVFKRGTSATGDGGLADPIESCGQRVQP